MRAANLVIAAMLAISPAAAQRAAVDDARSVRPFLGVALGGGPFPGALEPECHSGYDAWTPGVSADVRGGVIAGRLRVESRTSGFGSAVMEQCLFIGPYWMSGIHTDRVPAVERGGFALSDLRAGYVLRDGSVFLLLMGGAGWIWQRDIPVVILGTGAGVGRRFRFGMNADWLGSRIPWKVVTAEWQNGVVVREISTRREHDWRSGYSIRLSIEIAPFAIR